jgi:hypothetical protein
MQIETDSAVNSAVKSSLPGPLPRLVLPGGIDFLLEWALADCSERPLLLRFYRHEQAMQAAAFAGVALAQTSFEFGEGLLDGIDVRVEALVPELVQAGGGLDRETSTQAPELLFSASAQSPG